MVLQRFNAGDVKIKIAELTEHQFRGQYPDVPIYKAVDMELLTQGDDDPQFVTLAILGVNQISENGILYDEELVSAIEDQLQGEGGIRGHLGFFNGDDYPYDDVDWVGHLRDATGVTWAKGYVPPGPNREAIRRLRARGGRIGTSIYGYAQDVIEVEGYDDEDVYRLIGFELHTLDLVHHKRASLKMGQWSGFSLTSESADHDQAITITEAIALRNKPEETLEKEEDMPQTVQEETQPETPADNTPQVDPVAELKKKHQAHLAEMEARIAELEKAEKQLNTLAAVLGNPDDPKATLREMQTTIDTLTSTNADLLTDSIEKQVAEAVQIETMRPIIAQMVRAEKPATREAVADAVKQVIEQDAVKTMLRTAVTETMGPAQTRPINAQTEHDDSNSSEHRLQIPEVY